MPSLDLNSIPKDWNLCSVGKLAKFTRGISWSKEEASEGPNGIPVLSIPNIERGKLILQTKHYLRKNIPTDKFLSEGDILFVGSSGTLDNVARNARVPALPSAYTFASFTFAARADREKVLPDFLYFALNSDVVDFKKFSRRASDGKYNFQLHEFIESAVIPVPPLDKQRKMIWVFRLAEQAYLQQKRLASIMTEFRKTMLRKIFTEGLCGKGQQQTDMGLVPHSWDSGRLDKMGEVIYGIQAAVASNIKPVGTKILTNKNIDLDGRINLDAINYFEIKTPRHRATILKKGDLLFNWRSGSKEHVGKTAYFDLEGEFTHSSFILRIRPHDGLTGRFLFYYLKYLRESGFFVKSQTFSINAKFNKSAVNGLPVFLPAEDERREIVSVLDGVEKKIAVTVTKTRLLEALFRTLMHQLMTAQVRVDELDLPEKVVAAATC